MLYYPKTRLFRVKGGTIRSKLCLGLICVHVIHFAYFIHSAVWSNKASLTSWNSHLYFSHPNNVWILQGEIHAPCVWLQLGWKVLFVARAWMWALLLHSTLISLASSPAPMLHTGCDAIKQYYYTSSISHAAKAKRGHIVINAQQCVQLLIVSTDERFIFLQAILTTEIKTSQAIMVLTVIKRWFGLCIWLIFNRGL